MILYFSPFPLFFWLSFVFLAKPNNRIEVVVHLSWMSLSLLFIIMLKQTETSS